MNSNPFVKEGAAAATTLSPPVFILFRIKEQFYMLQMDDN